VGDPQDVLPLAAPAAGDDSILVVLGGTRKLNEQKHQSGIADFLNS
jgi:hypothetical protein